MLLMTSRRRPPDAGSSPVPAAEAVQHPRLMENRVSVEPGGVVARAGHLGVLAVREVQLELRSADTGMVRFSGAGR